MCRTKRRFVEGKLEAALSEEPRRGAGRKLSGKQALGQGGSPPDGDQLLDHTEGRRAPDPEMLARATLTLTEHAGLSRETVRRRLDEAFPACKAHRLLRRLDFHYTRAGSIW